MVRGEPSAAARPAGPVGRLVPERRCWAVVVAEGGGMPSG